jgi:hypothetical protein
LREGLDTGSADVQARAGRTSQGASLAILVRLAWHPGTQRAIR